MLDTQLDKIETFYLAREKEMLSRGQLLQLQLRELDDHRKLYQVRNKLFPLTVVLNTFVKTASSF